MELNKLPKTCSMAELGGVDPNYDFDSPARLSKFINSRASSLSPSVRGGGIFAIIYNSNTTNPAIIKKIKGAGFKSSGRYIGFNGNKVTTFIKYLRQPRKK